MDATFRTFKHLIPVAVNPKSCPVEMQAVSTFQINE